MQEQVNVMSADQYFQKYAVEGIGKGADRWMIKRQLIDAFRKEIFGLVSIRCKKEFNEIPPEGDPEASRIAKNIIHDTTMKWKKLCRMFAKYKETANLIDLNDLKLYDEIGDIGTTSEEANEALNGPENDIPENYATEDLNTEKEPELYQDDLIEGVVPVTEEETTDESEV